MPRDEFDDTTPFDEEEVNGYSVSVGGVLPGQTTKTIDDKSRFNIMEDGRHILRIKGFGGIPDQRQYSVYIGDTMYDFTGYSLRVIMCLSDDDHSEVSDFFTLPPSDPDELQAYNEGTKKPNDKRNAGFHARKLKSFLGHLGLIDPNTGEAVPEAARLGNWKVWPDGSPRYFTAETQLGDEQPDKNGKMRRYPNIVLFSYEDYIPSPPDGGGPENAPEMEAAPEPTPDPEPTPEPPPAARPIKPPVVTQQRPTAASPTTARPAPQGQKPAPPPAGNGTVPATRPPATRPPAKPKAAVNYDV